MWTFIQEQILGMKWLNVLIGDLLNTLGWIQQKKLVEPFNFLSMM